jgi:hypothetical protein
MISMGRPLSVKWKGMLRACLWVSEPTEWMIP